MMECASRHSNSRPYNIASLAYFLYLRFLQLAEEAGQWMMEGASHGIASTDCFELFGFPEDAPNLRDPDSSGVNNSETVQEALS